MQAVESLPYVAEPSMRAPAPAARLERIIPGSDKLDAVDKSMLSRFIAAGAADDFELPSADGELDMSLSSSRRLQLMRQRKLRNSRNATKLDINARGSMVTHGKTVGVRWQSQVPRSAAAIGASVASQNNTTHLGQNSAGGYSVQTLELLRPPSRTDKGFFGATVPMGGQLQSTVTWRKRTMASSSAAPQSASTATLGAGQEERPYTASFPARSLIRHPRRRAPSPIAALQDMNAMAVRVTAAAPPSPESGEHPAAAAAPADQPATNSPPPPAPPGTANAKPDTGDDELFLQFVRAKRPQPVTAQ